MNWLLDPIETGKSFFCGWTKALKLSSCQILQQIEHLKLFIFFSHLFIHSQSCCFPLADIGNGLVLLHVCFVSNFSGSYFARDASYSHVYTDQPKGCHAVSIHPSSQMIFNPPPSHHQMTNGPPGATTAQIIIQPFPGSSHSVSIATLQSCRFAHLPVVGNTTHLPHGSSLPPPVGQGSAASNPVSAFTFPYWVGNGGIPGSVGPGKVGRSSNDVNSSLTTMPHIHTMFVARVLVGECTLGKAGYRKPPPIDPSAPYGRCYDACVNDMTNPTIFVIFNSAQCYPEYIIEYTNRGKDS